MINVKNNLDIYVNIPSKIFRILRQLESTISCHYTMQIR